MLNLAIALGATTFVHFKFLPLGRGASIADQNPDPEQEKDLIKFLQEALEEGRIEIWSTAPEFGSIFLKNAILKQRSAPGNRSGERGWVDIFPKHMKGCGAGRYLCAVQANGKVTPCASRPFDNMGRLPTENLEEMWSCFQTKIKNCKEDLSCGGCRPRGDPTSGNLPFPDLGCLYQMLLFSRLEKLFLQSRHET